MSFAAKISANDTAAQALGNSTYGDATVQNLGPDEVWLYSNTFDGGATDGEKATQAVSLGTMIAVGTVPYKLSNINGVGLDSFTVACGTGKTADVRVLAT